jgi:uncharacterized protein (DUF1697 family)
MAESQLVSLCARLPKCRLFCGPTAAPSHTYTIFLDEPPPRDALKYATGAKDEQLQLGVREIYVHYGSGMGHSKLKIPAAKSGTARNMNTVSKLTDMVSKL